jgi:hypothetical protein
MEQSCIKKASAAENLPARGYSIVYRHDETNHCPGCGRTHWYIGRLSAQCAFCETAMPLAAGMAGSGSRREGHGATGEFPSEPL